MKVAKIMNKIMVVEDDISLMKAAKLMTKKRIGSLVFSDGEKLKGILTERDIVKNIDKLDKAISKVMSKKIITIDCNDNLEDAAEIMSRNKIRRLPVVSGDELVGIITARDLVAHVDGFEI